MKWAFCLLLCIFSFTTMAYETIVEECQSVEKKLHLLISRDEIRQKVAAVAEELNEFYKDKEVLLLMVLKGSIVFVSDLLQEMHCCVDLRAITASSYGIGFTSGELTLQGIDKLNIEGRHVLIADDIYDSGQTLTEIMKQIHKRNPASLKSIVLLNKEAPRVENNVEPDWAVFDVENRYIVGYGLDYKDYMRGMPGIYWLDVE